jgi:hypothetical protein
MKFFLKAHPNSLTTSSSASSSVAFEAQKSRSMSEFSDQELEQIEPMI